MHRNAKDLTGLTFGRLTVIDIHPVRAKDRAIQWRCLCQCGGETIVPGRALNAGNTRSCGCLNSWTNSQKAIERNRRDVVDYARVHDRLREVFGRAADHPCVDCGNQARDWSYDHQDPNERVSPRGLVFTEDLSHYAPRCISCHRNFDAAWRKSQRTEESA